MHRSPPSVDQRAAWLPALCSLGTQFGQDDIEAAACVPGTRSSAAAAVLVGRRKGREGGGRDGEKGEERGRGGTGKEEREGQLRKRFIMGEKRRCRREQKGREGKGR